MGKERPLTCYSEDKNSGHFPDLLIAPHKSKTATRLLPVAVKKSYEPLPHVIEQSRRHGKIKYVKTSNPYYQAA